jgi:23S rRNA pseudouridine1911/1915/1917 synthase
LEHWVLNRAENMTRVRIKLHTGRTHQIRAQFSGRGLPLVGDKKYGIPEDDCQIALWSCRLTFKHPYSGKPMEFQLNPPDAYPWSSC